MTFQVSAYPLTDAQKARLEKLIPRTFAKLQARESVHITMLGDSVTEMYTPDAETNHNYLHSYHVKFAEYLSVEFFYTGEVRLFNPEKGKPAKATEYLGEEIVIENFGLGGRTAIDSLQRITTDAFLNEPDLVILKYGINDAMMGLSLDAYTKSLQISIDECRKRGVDVILLAPTMVRVSNGPLEWGLTRGHAVAARKLAEKNGIFFSDMGKVIARTNGLGEDFFENIELADAQKTSEETDEDEDSEAKQAIRVVADKMGDKFRFSNPAKELLHPNLAAHEAMGKALYEQLFNGEPAGLFRVQGRAVFQDVETVRVELMIKNGGKEMKEGYIGALTTRRVLEPSEESAFQYYSIESGATEVFSFTYKRQQRNFKGGATSRYQSLDPGEPWVPFSFLLADEEGSSVVDITPILEPVKVTWKEGLQVEAKEGIRLAWRFNNGEKKAVNGTYEIKMGQRKASGKFNLEAGGQKDFFAQFPINEKEDVISFKETVELAVNVEGKTFVFFREIEANRDLALGEKVALSHDQTYTPGARTVMTVPAGKEAVYFRADADKEALYVTLDIDNIQLDKTPNGTSMSVELFIDGRPEQESRSLGFIERVRVTFAAADGPGQVKLAKMGLFGDAYDRVVDPVGVRTLLKSKGNVAKKVEIRVPRIYLYRHGWKLGQDGQVLGLNAWVSFAKLGADGTSSFPPNRRWVIANSGLYFRDARSLITLNLGKKSTQAVGWSVRLY